MERRISATPPFSALELSCCHTEMERAAAA